MPKTINDIVRETQVKVTYQGQAIHVHAESQHLILRPADATDVPAGQAIWSSEKAMALFAMGVPLRYKDKASEEAGTINYAQDRIVDREGSWCKHWQSGNPWSGMTIIQKETGERIGFIAIQDTEGELSYLTDEKYWGKGYAFKAAVMIVYAVLPALSLAGVPNIPKNIEACAHPDNIASNKILTKLGMILDPTKTTSVFGDKVFPRKCYNMPTAGLIENYVAIKSAESQKAKKPKHSFPLFELRKISDYQVGKLESVNIGGHNLRKTPARMK